MSNLLQETIEELKDNGLTPEDVKFCCVDEGYFSWEEFKVLADIEYYNSYGIEEVLSDLQVVGQDWWLERHDYDGSEWWEFKRLPVQTTPYVPKTLLYR